jgi:hypothetical protein
MLNVAVQKKALFWQVATTSQEHITLGLKQQQKIP